MVKEDRSDWVAVQPEFGGGDGNSGLGPPPIKPAKSAYQFFQKENASSIHHELSTSGLSTDVGALGKEVSSRWQKLSSPDRKKYEDMATADKNRYLSESHKRDVEVAEEKERLRKERDTLILDDQGEEYGGRATRRSRQKGQRKAEKKRAKKEEKKKMKKAAKKPKAKKVKKKVADDDSDYEDDSDDSNSSSSYNSDSSSASSVSSDSSSDSDDSRKQPAKRSVQVSQAVLGKVLLQYTQDVSKFFYASIKQYNKYSYALI